MNDQRLAELKHACGVMRDAKHPEVKENGAVVGYLFTESHVECLLKIMEYAFERLQDEVVPDPGIRKTSYALERQILLWLHELNCGEAMMSSLESCDFECSYTVRFYLGQMVRDGKIAIRDDGDDKLIAITDEGRKCAEKAATDRNRLNAALDKVDAKENLSFQDMDAIIDAAKSRRSLMAWC